MMKNTFIYFVLFTLPMFSNFLRADELQSKLELNVEAQKIVKMFAGTLKPKLKKAIKSGGLEHAINICAIEAPKIAKDLSAKTGWNVKRVSLKPRNKESATPDAFEKKILEQFNERQIKGELPSSISYSEVIDDKFKFMKAQGIQGVCLNCHGKSINTNVKEAIAKHYADDVATGYSLGQIRGAISLTKRL